MKIVLRDGEVFANSAVLADVSDYFTTMLNNPNFVESQTKEVLMLEYGTVKAMGQIVDYVYTGVMKLDEEIAEGFMDFENLLEILNILRIIQEKMGWCQIMAIYWRTMVCQHPKILIP